MNASRAALQIILFVLALLPSRSSGDEIDMSLGCRANPAVVAPCETFRGRLSVYNGSPMVRIWPAKTNRLKGLIPSEDQRIVPKHLRNHVQFGVEIWADFEFCPFTRDKPGHMQMGCVESVLNAVAYDNRGEGPVKISRIPGSDS